MELCEEYTAPSNCFIIVDARRVMAANSYLLYTKQNPIMTLIRFSLAAVPIYNHLPQLCS